MKCKRKTLKKLSRKCRHYSRYGKSRKSFNLSLSVFAFFKSVVQGRMLRLEGIQFYNKELKISVVSRLKDDLNLVQNHGVVLVSLLLTLNIFHTLF